MRRSIAAIALALACLPLPQAPADSFQPIDLRVEGGQDSWHRSQLFNLNWTNPPGTVAAVHYRLLGPSGEVLIGDKTMAWAATSITPLRVGEEPGVYTAEVWLEDGSGGAGPPVPAKLRFDDTPPGRVEAETPTGWIGRTDFPYAIRLSGPAGPLPPSGIRGYAVSVDASPNGDPCPGAGACEANVTAQAGMGSFAVPDLPEGQSYVHAVAISGAGVASAGPSNATVRVDETDPVTTIEGVPAGWSRTPVVLRANAGDEASGMATAGTGAPFTAIRIDGGAPIIAAGDSVSTTVIGAGVHTVAYYARDAAGNVNDGGTSNGHPNRGPATALVRIDRDPPALVFLAAQSPADPERIEARAADAGSGLDPGRGSIAVRRLGSGDRFAPLPTDTIGDSLAAHWNSAIYPPGEYEFQVTVYDRAGNQATSSLRADGTPMRLRGPLKLPVRIVGASHRRTLRYGRGTWFGGRLVAARRTPLAGMPVRVSERFAAGSVPSERVSTVRTGADGRFGLHLPPGPSRGVSAEVAPTATTYGARSGELVLDVRSHVVFHVSAPTARVGGRPVVFRGRVAAGGVAMPAEGKTVQLQFRLPGLPWREFRGVRSDRQGRFHYAYRFSDDDSRGVRFQFRAYAPAQTGWPFEPAGSLPVSVLGT
jgi:hypothetical protein